jgi:hypothetical protein
MRRKEFVNDDDDDDNADIIIGWRKTLHKTFQERVPKEPLNHARSN